MDNISETENVTVSKNELTPSTSSKNINVAAAEEDLDSDDSRSAGSEHEDESTSENEEADVLAATEDDDEEETNAEEEEDSEQSSSGSDSDEPESDDSSSDDENVWGDEKTEKTTITLEATESAALVEFNTALQCIVNGDTLRAIRLFRRILRNPLVSVYHTIDFDWEKEQDERLSKMARLFVGVHKNLATLVLDEAVDHYLQILSISPRNQSIWFDLGLKMVDKGDLDMAAFAFEKCSDPDGQEALAGVLFLMGNHHACLQRCKQIMESNPTSQKALFLKEKIRDSNKHFSEFCDQLFGENRTYDVPKKSNGNYSKQASIRLSQLQERIAISRVQNCNQETLSPIEVKLDETHTLSQVATVLCDLFDRIQSFSSLSRQTLSFVNWWDRRILLETHSTVEYLLDCVELIEDMLTTAEKSPVVEEDVVKQIIDETIIYRRSTRKIEGAMSAESEDDESDEPHNEISEFASDLGFYPHAVMPLRKLGSSYRPSRTPTPGLGDCFNEEEMLSQLRKMLINNTDEIMNIQFCLKSLLLALVEYCPDRGIIPLHEKELWIQCYRRFNTCGGKQYDEDKFVSIHLLFSELDDPEARSFCQHWSLMGKSFISRNMTLRYAWDNARVCSDEQRISLFKWLQEELKEHEFISTSTGGFCLDDVNKKIDRIERTLRIQSLKALRLAGKHEELIRIVANDVDWNSVEEDDMIETSTFWMESLIELQKWTDAGWLLARLLEWHTKNHPLMCNSTKELLLSVEEKVQWKEVDKKTRDTIGYQLYILCKNEDLVKWWPLWRFMYHLAQINEGPISMELLHKQLLDNGSASDSLPTKAIGVLARAHDRMGSAECCTQNECSFLAFYLRELATIVSVPSLCSVIKQFENSWMLTNLNDEIAQLLSCAFGKYSKKRRIVDEHGHTADLKGKKAQKIKESVITVALPCPLPVFDDKERLGHDIIDLITSKFPDMIEIDDIRKGHVEIFKKWMHHGKESEDWPTVTTYTSLEANVFYVFALHNYRVSSHGDAALFASLFLTSGYATADNPVTYSAWAILAHTMVYHLFQISDENMLQQWSWHVLPFKMAIRFKPNEAILHFENAQTLYQVATRISRFLDRLPCDDPRNRRGWITIDNLRNEALRGFENALHLSTATYSDFHWLCYFFMAKINAKLDLDENETITRVLDGFYEAACSLELSGYAYPAKIAVKNQKNVEPIEVHYQAHAAVWKFITRCPSPSRHALLKCLSYLRALQSHGVCRDGNSSLFTILPEIHHVVLELTDRCCQREGDDIVSSVLDDVIQRADLIEELTRLCHKGFEVCVDRFPHMKAYYRLTEMCMQRNDWEKAHTHLVKGILRRSGQKKKEDCNLFEGVVEITCTDIDRSGSYTFYVDRIAGLSITVFAKTKDHQSLSSFICSILEMMRSSNIEYLPLHRHMPLIWRAWCVLKEIVKKEKKTPTIKQDLYRIYHAIEKLSTISTSFMSKFRNDVTILITTISGDVRNFVNEMSLAMETKKKQYRKRKITVESLAITQPPDIPLSSLSDVAPNLGNTMDDHMDEGNTAKLLKLISMSFGGT